MIAESNWPRDTTTTGQQLSIPSEEKGQNLDSSIISSEQRHDGVGDNLSPTPSWRCSQNQDDSFSTFAASPVSTPGGSVLAGAALTPGSDVVVPPLTSGAPLTGEIFEGTGAPAQQGGGPPPVATSTNDLLTDRERERGNRVLHEAETLLKKLLKNQSRAKEMMEKARASGDKKKIETAENFARLHGVDLNEVASSSTSKEHDFLSFSAGGAAGGATVIPVRGSSAPGGSSSFDLCASPDQHAFPRGSAGSLDNIVVPCITVSHPESPPPRYSFSEGAVPLYPTRTTAPSEPQHQVVATPCGSPRAVSSSASNVACSSSAGGGTSGAAVSFSPDPFSPRPEELETAPSHVPITAIAASVADCSESRLRRSTEENHAVDPHQRTAALSCSGSLVGINVDQQVLFNQQEHSASASSSHEAHPSSSKRGPEVAQELLSSGGDVILGSSEEERLRSSRLARKKELPQKWDLSAKLAEQQLHQSGAAQKLIDSHAQTAHEYKKGGKRINEEDLFDEEEQIHDIKEDDAGAAPGQGAIVSVTTKQEVRIRPALTPKKPQVVPQTIVFKALTTVGFYVTMSLGCYVTGGKYPKYGESFYKIQFKKCQISVISVFSDDKGKGSDPFLSDPRAHFWCMCTITTKSFFLLNLFSRPNRAIRGCTSTRKREKWGWS